MEKKSLSVTDYALFVGSLLLALFIGLYQAWKGRKDTAKELVVASKGLSLAPITLSLVATYLSAVLLLGMTILCNVRLSLGFAAGNVFIR